MDHKVFLSFPRHHRHHHHQYISPHLFKKGGAGIATHDVYSFALLWSVSKSFFSKQQRASSCSFLFLNSFLTFCYSFESELCCIVQNSVAVTNTHTRTIMRMNLWAARFMKMMLELRLKNCKLLIIEEKILITFTATLYSSLNWFVFT